MSNLKALRKELTAALKPFEHIRGHVPSLVSVLLPVVESWASTAGNEQGLRAHIEALADELDRTAWRASHEPAYSRLASETSAKLRALLLETP